VEAVMSWLAQVVAGLVLALLKWLEGRHEKSKTAVEADRHRAALDRIGQRVRAWEDRAHNRGQSGSDRPGHDGPGVSPD